MKTPLVRQIHYRFPFVVRRVPFVARYYRLAFERRGSRKTELFLYTPLRRLFAHYLRLLRQPSWGVFEYERLGARHTVRCDGRIRVLVFMGSQATHAR